MTPATETRTRSCTQALSHAPVAKRLDWSELPGALPQLRRYLRRRCSDPNDAEDVMQETLLRAARYRRTGDGPRHMRSWLCCIAGNVLVDMSRRRMPVLTSEEDQDPLQVAEELMGYEPEEDPPCVLIANTRTEHDTAMTHLFRAFQDLSVADQQVLRTFYAGQGTTVEVAERLGLPRHLVKIRLFRARRRLRQRVERRTLNARLFPYEPCSAGLDEPQAAFLR